MKRIVKIISPIEFEKWKVAFTGIHHHNPCYSDLVGEAKQEFKQELLKEQGFLCCYCMKRIEYYDSHIEHFKPQSLGLLGEDLNYFNMFVSCEGYSHSRDSCGHKKDNWYDARLSVNPLEVDVEGLFQYSIDGHISSTDVRGTETISHLELNNYHLIRARKTAIYTSGIFETDFEKNKENVIRLFFDRNDNDEYIPFCVAVLYCASHT